MKAKFDGLGKSLKRIFHGTEQQQVTIVPPSVSCLFTKSTKFTVHFIFLAVLTGGCFLNSAYASQEPTEQLRPFLDKITTVLADGTASEHGAMKKADRVMDVVKEGFDFQEMSKRVLGKKWRSLADSEREKFVGLFTQLLKYAYVAKLDHYSNQKVEYVRQRIKGNRAEVQTLLVDGDRRIPVSYIMLLKHEHWMVYDVVVEGVSLVRNYLEQFRAIIRKGNFDALTRQIELKIAEFQRASSAG